MVAHAQHPHTDRVRQHRVDDELEPAREEDLPARGGAGLEDLDAVERHPEHQQGAGHGDLADEVHRLQKGIGRRPGQRGHDDTGERGPGGVAVPVGVIDVVPKRRHEPG